MDTIPIRLKYLLKPLNPSKKGSKSVPAGSQTSFKNGGFFMPFAYIIYSAKLNKYYVGACTDMERRLHEHSIGHSKFTSVGIPWILKHTEFFSNLARSQKARIGN